MRRQKTMSSGSKMVITDMPFSVMSSEADIDYLLARMIAFSGGHFQGRAGYFGQMACEKYLKALSIQEKGTHLEIHRLVDLAADCQKTYGFLGKKEVAEGLRL